MNTSLPVLAGAISTFMFMLGALPMLHKAFRTKDLASYSLGHIGMMNAGNLIHAIYVFSLPPGPIWALHGFWLVSTGLMLAWICLGIFGCTQYTRYARGAMVEALGEDRARLTLTLDMRERNSLREIELGSLSEDETLELAELVADRPLDLAERSTLFEGTDGLPLLIVELAGDDLVRGLDHEGGNLLEEAIPLVTFGFQF